MAAADYNGVVQQLYVSYFGRPADTFGLKNFSEQLNAIGAPTTIAALNAQVQADATGNSALSQLVNSFSASGEATALYGTDTTQLGVSKFVAAIYQNVFGREADKAGFDFWVAAIESGNVTRASAVADITAGALVNTSAQGMLDKMTVEKKVAVATNFTTALDLPSEFNAYAGEAAAATARGLLQGVTSTTDVTAYQSNIETAVATIAAVAVPGQNLLLTANIDNLTGGAGNDNFGVTISTTVPSPIGPLDIIDGGAGRDTLSIADTSGAQLSLAGLTLRSIENLAVSSTAAFTDVNIAATGVTSAFMSSTGAGASKVTAAGTTDVTLTTANAANAEVVGGKAVTVNGTGANVVSGTALTGVTVKGGTATITNTTATAGTNGTTLTAVTLDSVTGATVTGNGLTNVSLANVTTAANVAVVNAATNGYALTLNVNKVGTIGTAPVVATVTAAEAKTVAINATGASNVALTAVAATAATVTGAAALELNVAGSTLLTSVDGSAAAGGLTLTGNSERVAMIKTGAGADKITTAATAAKVTFDLGAGNDTLTMGGALLAGSTINLGAGDDVLLGAGAVASTTAAPSVIDGGEGTDTISAGLINASNAALFRNFESLDLSGTANLDVQLITGSAITGLTLNGAVGGVANATVLTNVAANVGLTVAGVNTGTSTINLATTTATDNVFNVGFSGAAVTGAAATTANVDAGTVVLNGVETVNIASTGAANTWNAITLTDNALKTVTITGEKNLDLDFTGTIGVTGAANGLALIDGSAATGKLAINLVTGAPTYVGGAALTIRGGAADDTITLGATTATVVAGAGNDTIVTGAAGGTLTGGAGNDIFNVTLAIAPASPTAANSVLTTITDFTVGDKIDLGSAVGFTSTKLVLGQGVTNLEGAFAQAAADATNAVTWFQYGTDTYIVADNGAGNTFDAGDVVVKLTGLIDLSTATIGATDGIVTL